MFIFPDRPKIVNDCYLGVYSDPFGVASILFNFENNRYNILKMWVKTGLVSLSEGVNESFKLLDGMAYNHFKAYLNDSQSFELLFRKESSNYRVSYITKSELEPVEAYQIINSPLAENRIALAEGLTDIESALKSFDLTQVDHIVYCLFYSVAQKELDEMKPKPRVYGSSTVHWAF